MDELLRYVKENKILPQSVVRGLLVILAMDKPVLAKGKVYYITEPISADPGIAPAASQLVEYLGFDNLESDKPGTPATHLFFSRLLKQKTVFRLTTQQLRPFVDDRKFFVVTGKATTPVPELAKQKTAQTPGSDTKPPEMLTASEDPGFSAVIQALSSTTLQFQSDDRISFQSIITDVLQGQRVFNTLGDINQSLGIVQTAYGSFESKVSQWENRFAVFFQQHRPESVGMTTINTLKAQQNKGRSHLGPTKYQFGKLIANLEQAKINMQPTDQKNKE